VLRRAEADERGRVLSAEPAEGEAGYGLDQEARRVALRARFEPARRDGRPVRGETRLAVRFEIQR
jgi:TonB family protein